MVVPVGHQEGDRGELPRPPRYAPAVKRSTNTPRTRELRPGEETRPGRDEHRDLTAEDPEPPPRLAWAVCVGTRLHGPEGGPPQQCGGPTWPVRTMLVWPSCSWTVLRSAPAAWARLAAPWRRSCSRTGGSCRAGGGASACGRRASRAGRVWFPVPA